MLSAAATGMPCTPTALLGTGNCCCSPCSFSGSGRQSAVQFLQLGESGVFRDSGSLSCVFLSRSCPWSLSRSLPALSVSVGLCRSLSVSVGLGLSLGLSLALSRPLSRSGSLLTGRNCVWRSVCVPPCGCPCCGLVMSGRRTEQVANVGPGSGLGAKSG